ncbi:DUF799 domain-containing protein [Alkalimonas delamerensis]|uniref:DUF799 domain-containing protein n=1 Tax=Alkalimonas delamerensis TaxID=265981 RepID=A0ABT9GTZ2_9GAMM|nr:DUF799 domain-containing protein [Alkalimonas delamerensis]MDP4530096.1 DUF799 domain-containing protein [Alkalimonas delamerensis]
MQWLKFALVGAVLVLSGCVSMPPAHDYSAFRSADPHSVLVLPPINNSVEVIAPYSLMSQVTGPIAESGYYVFPVTLVEQTFRNNGLTEATDIHAVAFERVHEIFGADTGLYLTIDRYGTSYAVLSSDTVVAISATLVDLRTGTVLWQDKATASSAENRGNSGGGLVGMLIEAAMNQIIETITDRGFDIAAMSSNRLLFAEGHNGLLYGPRSPKYGQPAPSERKN